MVLETKGLSIVAKAEHRVAMLPCTVITVGIWKRDSRESEIKREGERIAEYRSKAKLAKQVGVIRPPTYSRLLFNSYSCELLSALRNLEYRPPTTGYRPPTADLCPRPLVLCPPGKYCSCSAHETEKHLIKFRATWSFPCSYFHAILAFLLISFIHFFFFWMYNFVDKVIFYIYF